MVTDELVWEPPGPGVWWYSREHMPAPVTALFASVFSGVTDGWVTGARRYGIPLSRSAWALANGYLYFSPGPGAPPATDDDEAAAAAALEGRAWRDDVARWLEVERPAVVARNRELQAVDLGALSNTELADHVRAAVDHFTSVAPLHFEHMVAFDLAAGLLFSAAAEWGIDDASVATLLTGSSPATSATLVHLDRIASALPEEPVSIDDIRRHAPAELAAYLDEYGWRCLGHDLAEPTLAERPELVVASVRAFSTGRSPAAAPSVDAVRSQVPERERPRFDELLDDARRSYRLRDDDVGVCFTWPLGLVRRAALEAARRLDLVMRDDVLEATPEEIAGCLRGCSGPDGATLHDRAEARRRAWQLEPPPQLGEMPSDWGSGPPPPPTVARLMALRQVVWSAGSGVRGEGALHGIGVGTEVGRGRACVLDGRGAVDRVREGDVVVATMTTTAHNVVLPLAVAIATEEGGLFSHAAILARELGIPAVLGVTGLLARVREGELIEVDPVAGVVRPLPPD